MISASIDFLRSRNSPYDWKGNLGMLGVEFTRKLLADDGRIDCVDAAVARSIAGNTGSLENEFPKIKL